MELIHFNSHSEYIEAQKRTLAARGIGPYFTWVEIANICEYLQRSGIKAQKAICHGARNGLECDEFRKHLDGLDVFGTDLFPYSGRSRHHKGESQVIEWDFHVANSDWIGKFDFVYSNSLDHSHDPEGSLDVWMRQIKSTGRVLLQYTKSHVHAGNRIVTGDCFGVEFWEFVALCNKYGTLDHLVYSKAEFSSKGLARRALESVVFCVKKR